jgi:hypothetical protein
MFPLKQKGYVDETYEEDVRDQHGEGHLRAYWRGQDSFDCVSH